MNEQTKKEKWIIFHLHFLPLERSIPYDFHNKENKSSQLTPYAYSLTSRIHIFTPWESILFDIQKEKRHIVFMLDVDMQCKRT